MARKFDKQLCTDDCYWINETQLQSIKYALEDLREVKISELSKGSKEEIKKACGALFCAIGKLHVVTGQVEGTLEY